MCIVTLSPRVLMSLLWNIQRKLYCCSLQLEAIKLANVTRNIAVVLIIVTSISMLIPLTVSPKLVQTKETVNKLFGSVSKSVAVHPEGHTTEKSYIASWSFLPLSTAAGWSSVIEEAVPKAYCLQLCLFCLLPVLIAYITVTNFQPRTPGNISKFTCFHRNSVL